MCWWTRRDVARTSLKISLERRFAEQPRLFLDEASHDGLLMIFLMTVPS